VKLTQYRRILRNTEGNIEPTWERYLREQYSSDLGEEVLGDLKEGCRASGDTERSVQKKKKSINTKDSVLLCEGARRPRNFNPIVCSDPDSTLETGGVLHTC
jgi:hypothetical protein